MQNYFLLLCEEQCNAFPFQFKEVQVTAAAFGIWLRDPLKQTSDTWKCIPLKDHGITEMCTWEHPAPVSQRE